MPEAPTLDVSVRSLKGVGPALARRLSKMDIRTVRDLLLHLPQRYEDRSKITPIGSLQVGVHAVIQGEIAASEVVTGRRRSLLVIVEDDSGRIGLRFYHFTASARNTLTPGRALRCYGEIRRGASGFELYHPEYRLLQDLAAEPESTFTPVYPTTEGLTQQRMRVFVTEALTHVERWNDDLTAALNANLDHSLPDAVTALRTIHEPAHAADLDALVARTHNACERLILEELLAHHLALRRSRAEAQGASAPAFEATSKEAELVHQLPFSLTNAQRRVCTEIANDLSRGQPMQRLLQGDVGSGKTVVAAMAIARVATHAHQAAIMAPTEILAEQHLASFSEWLEPLGLEVALLTSRIRGRARTTLLNALESGEISVLVGTHALFQPDVTFRNLALIVVDEQHRFGVHQRLDLREKGMHDSSYPHQLVMTATPIPRTLTMSIYADLDVSVIDELPAGRRPVTTVAVGDDRRDEVMGRIANACTHARQVYWVCTLIEESEVLQCEAAQATAKRLATELPALRVGLIHGRMKAHEKAMTMDAFKAGDIQLLVATTVIEVGVDVPNASLMVIENAERLGLAQLHQLRGRVGRGETQSHCVLMYHPPLSEQAKARVAVMRQTNDGFVIAEKDLELRGPGELLGTRQTGLVHYRVADLLRDRHLLEQVRRIAARLPDASVDIDRLISIWCQSEGNYAQV